MKQMEIAHKNIVQATGVSASKVQDALRKTIDKLYPISRHEEYTFSWRPSAKILPDIDVDLVTAMTINELQNPREIVTYHENNLTKLPRAYSTQIPAAYRRQSNIERPMYDEKRTAYSLSQRASIHRFNPDIHISRQ